MQAMIFDVSDDAYDRFMGRYSRRLAPVFAEFAGVQAGDRVLDAGAGTGALTAELVQRGIDVAAAEPSAGFVAGLQARFPEIEVREAPAEKMPWADASFDAALAQLVVAFVADAPAAARELARLVRPGGTVAVCMWDVNGLDLRLPIHAARQAAAPDAQGSTALGYRTEEEIRGLLEGAGLRAVESELLQVEAEYAGFDDYWDAVLGAVGPDTKWIRTLPAEQLPIARAAAQAALPAGGSFALRARAHAVRGVVE
jgi:SAM-dependent methyltransferase